MTSPDIPTRDAGLALISRLNRWLLAAAVGFSGLVSLVAAHAFHGRTVSTGASSAGVSSTRQGSRPASAGSGSLQPPAQAPAASPASPTPAVSGGS